MGGVISIEDVRETEYTHSQPNQQYQRQRQLRHQQRRHISSFSTQELLEYLEGEFLSKVDIIRNMKKEKNFDDGGRTYICDVMIETENNLRKFNRGMKSGRSADQSRQTATSDEEIQRLKCEINDLKKENSRLQHEKKYLDGLLATSMKRPSASLSKIHEKPLVDDNPATDDLSDPNRPQKLGVFYSELYDNEWTDAFDALTNSGYDDKEAIITLRLTLINVLEFCDSKSSILLKKTEEAVKFLFKEYRDFQEKKSQKQLTLKVSQSGQRLSDSSFDCGSDEYVDVQERWKTKKSYPEQAKEQQEPEVAQKSDVIVEKLKVFRKEVAESMVPIVQKAYISASWKNEYILELKPFIKKCVFLGWMMVVQSPPMCLTTCKEGGRFDKNTFKEFTKSGPTVDFVVLPALYLYENGPLIGKGVAEARK